MNRPSLVASTPHAAVVLGDDASPDLAMRLRGAMTSQTGLDGLLEVLQSEGYRRVPSFVCAAFEGEDVRILARGDFSVRVSGGPRDEEVVTPPGTLATWLENVIPEPASLTFSCGDQEALFWAGTARESSDRDPRYQDADSGSPVEVGLPEAVDPPRPPDKTLAELDVGREPEPEPEPEPTPAHHQVPDHTIRKPSTTSEEGVPAGLPPLPPTPPKVRQAGDDASASPEDEAESHAGPEDVSPAPSTSGQGESAQPPTAGGLIQGVPRFGSPDPAAAPPPPSDTESTEGDHDGLTVARDHVHRLHDQQADRDDSAQEGTVGIPSVVCPQGHPNPPHATACQSCAAGLGGAQVQRLPRPTVARLRIDTGDVVELDRSQVIGRQPTVDVDSSLGDLVGLVTIPDGDKQLSRSHVEIRVEGWTMTVTDLGSTNGTWVQLPGQERVRIRARTPTPVIVGTVVGLADVATIVVEAPQ